MKKILLLDPTIATINLGDEIIKESIFKNFPEILDGNYIYNLPTHTKTFSYMQKFIYKKRMSLYHTADYKFLCGTNALYMNMLRPMPTWNINLFNYDLYKNTILLGVGLGVNGKKPNLYTKLLYKKVLSKKYIHSVRDEKTKNFLISLGYKAVNTGCPTLWGMTPEHCKSIPKEKSDSVIFTLTCYEPDTINDQLMIDILLKNYKNVYFWPQSINDIDYLKSLNNIESINIVSPNLYSYDKILNSNIDYVGNRLHGGIYAMQHKCRSIIISIDYRAIEMSKNFSIKCIEREKISSKLESLINSKWETKINGIDFKLIEQWKKQFIDEK